MRGIQCMMRIVELGHVQQALNASYTLGEIGARLAVPNVPLYQNDSRYKVVPSASDLALTCRTFLSGLKVTWLVCSDVAKT